MQTLINDESALNPQELKLRNHSKKMTFEEIIPLMASPDSGKSLKISADSKHLTDGTLFYPIRNGLPLLYPAGILQDASNGGLNFEYYTDPLKQYFLLSQIKQHGEINAPFDSVHYHRHLYRMYNFLETCVGTILDVGCDDVDISSALFREGGVYVGLDPFASDFQKLRVVGVGESLPFSNASFDNVVFNTSLDHILDYHTAIEEAFRVLKPSGRLYIATLIWEKSATLLSDSVHFHHFREYELLGALQEKMEIVDTKKYSYKEDAHRYSMFVCARKPY